MNVIFLDIKDNYEIIAKVIITFKKFLEFVKKLFWNFCEIVGFENQKIVL